MLGGFSFTKVPEITEGLTIPVGNDIRPNVAAFSVVPTPPPQDTEPNVVPTAIKRKKPFVPTSTLKKLNIDANAFTPMTNIVPTIEPVIAPTVEPESEPEIKQLSRKAKQRITPQDLDLEEIGALDTKKEKISYLAMRGWSLKVERRGNTFYHYATKYIKRKKKRFYLGSVNEC